MAGVDTPVVVVVERGWWWHGFLAVVVVVVVRGDVLAQLMGDAATCV